MKPGEFTGNYTGGLGQKSIRRSLYDKKELSENDFLYFENHTCPEQRQMLSAQKRLTQKKSKETRDYKTT